MKSKYILSTIIISVSLVLAGCGLQGNVSTPSATVQSTPTLTPFSTLSEQESFETFASLIEKDGGCNLPCWLGIIPGQTNFDDVVNNFSQFSSISYTEFSSERAFIQVYFPNFETAIHSTATGVTHASDGEVSRIWVYAGVDPKASGNITYSNPSFQKLWQRYFVPGIFITHGPPEKIFLDTTLVTGDPATSYPFALWIVYPQQGFLIRYDGDNIKTGENIRICPMQSRIEITIWDVEKSNYEEFMKNAEAGGISLGPQPIESVTGFDIESFYETFRGGQLDTCFETPASIWPPN